MQLQGIKTKDRRMQLLGINTKHCHIQLYSMQGTIKDKDRLMELYYCSSCGSSSIYVLIRVL